MVLHLFISGQYQATKKGPLEKEKKCQKSEVLTSITIKTEEKEKYDTKQTNSRRQLLLEKRTRQRAKKTIFYYEHHY